MIYLICMPEGCGYTYQENHECPATDNTSVQADSLDAITSVNTGFIL